jgi:hypothetical protein
MKDYFNRNLGNILMLLGIALLVFGTLSSCNQEDEVLVLNPGDTVTVDTAGLSSILCSDLYGTWSYLESDTDQSIEFIDTDSSDIMIYSYEVFTGSRDLSTYSLADCNGGSLYFLNTDSSYSYNLIHPDTLIVYSDYIPGGTLIKQ